jgi:hypothetical protein
LRHTLSLLRFRISKTGDSSGVEKVVPVVKEVNLAWSILFLLSTLITSAPKKPRRQVA